MMSNQPILRAHQPRESSLELAKQQTVPCFCEEQVRKLACALPLSTLTCAHGIVLTGS